MNLIGDVKGKVAVMVDDMIDTAGSTFLFCFCVLNVFLVGRWSTQLTLFSSFLRDYHQWSSSSTPRRGP